jgi:hypothetical protein
MQKQKIYLEIARLHIKNIEQGFLSSLGENFLALLYQSIDQSSKSILIVTKKNNRVIGFVAGTLDIKDVYIQLLKTPTKLLASLIPQLTSFKKITSIFSLIFYAEKNQKLPMEELLSIAIHKDFRGQAYATNLFNKLVAYFTNNNVKDFKILVGESLHNAHRFYNKMGAINSGCASLHRDKIVFVYIYSL